MIDFIVNGLFPEPDINNLPIPYKAKNPALQQGFLTFSFY
jgi:hypothetical protein